MFTHLPACTWQHLGVVVIAAIVVVVIDRWGGKRGEVGSPLGTCNNGKQRDILFRGESGGEGEVKHRSSVEHRYTGSLTLYLGNMGGVMGEGDTSIGCG